MELRRRKPEDSSTKEPLLGIENVILEHDERFADEPLAKDDQGGELLVDKLLAKEDLVDIVLKDLRSCEWAAGRPECLGKCPMSRPGDQYIVLEKYYQMAVEFKNRLAEYKNTTQREYEHFKYMIHNIRLVVAMVITRTKYTQTKKIDMMKTSKKMFSYDSEYNVHGIARIYDGHGSRYIWFNHGEILPIGLVVNEYSINLVQFVITRSEARYIGNTKRGLIITEKANRN